ncbi:MAG TPA: sigma-70 family RNA polymerase sigma factor [Ktedonobacteraceae bacterium]
MSSLQFTGPTNDDSDGDINEMLERFDPYVVALARKKAPRSVAQAELFGDVVDELAQRTRIKLWQATQRQHIKNPRPYIRCIIRTESIDMMRSYKHVLPLPTDEDGELYQGDLLVSPSEGMDDPASELEQKEAATDLIEAIADTLRALPPRQHFAMTCYLLERVSDIRQFIKALKKREVNVEMVQWPYDKAEAHRLKASVATARRKLAQRMALNMPVRKKSDYPTRPILSRRP